MLRQPQNDHNSAGHRVYPKNYIKEHCDNSSGLMVLCVCQLKTTDHVMSNDTVSFHYVSPGQMYMFDFLLYRLKRRQTQPQSADRSL